MSDNVKDNKKDMQNQNKIVKPDYSGLGHIMANHPHAFVVRKAERLASALYVITGFIPADEPVRGRLRTCALDLINRSIDQAQLHGTGVDTFGARCIEIGSILEVAQSGGLISPMNAKLICDEYTSLASFVREYAEKISTGSSQVEAAVATSFDPGLSIGHSYKNKRPLENVSIKANNQNNLESKGHPDRKQLILNLLKNKDKISIKDAVNAMSGYSEKTIQRELLALVKDGLLIKEGERRWSTYRRA